MLTVWPTPSFSGQDGSSHVFVGQLGKAVGAIDQARQRCSRPRYDLYAEYIGPRLPLHARRCETSSQVTGLRRFVS